jgi:hypothetical protein
MKLETKLVYQTSVDMEEEQSMSSEYSDCVYVVICIHGEIVLSVGEIVRALVETQIEVLESARVHQSQINYDISQYRLV